MPWVVGIDEAGYGPNLGPLVQAAVALHLPDGDHAGWDTLQPVVRRCCDVPDSRLLIDDSKKVYTRFGLAALELGVMSSLILTESTVGDVLRRGTLAGVGIREVLASEVWYDPAESTPVAVTGEEVLAAFTGFHEALTDDVGIGLAEAIIVPTPRFNRFCDEFGSKAVVLSHGLIELIPSALDAMPRDNKPVVFLCDKHGGRNYYGAMLQEAFPDWLDRPGARIGRRQPVSR